ncbi:MAG: CCC motif membrane protein [Bacteroidota bacterium]
MEKQKLNTTVIYILSVVGFLCCCVAGMGMIPAGIAFFMANGKVKEWKANPDNYENGNAMNTAKIIALVVLIINVLYFLYTLYYINSLGGWDAYMEQVRMMSEQYS